MVLSVEFIVHQMFPSIASKVHEFLSGRSVQVQDTLDGQHPTGVDVDVVNSV